ncbi:hypothetical protein V1L52_12420 [Treponema sp. HNW]|uniref:hypothetical protein n=1 Tax=Treponema sp. HNW TaxID=3116654 RepID=UPI003D0EEF44
MKKLALAVIPDRYTDLFTETVGKTVCGKQILFSGRGTASSALLRHLGIGSTRKTVIGFLSCEEAIEAVCRMCEREARQHKDCGGILCTVSAENTMAKKSAHTLMCIIVNSGYGETVMEAARKAGAPGGTIIDARGTGTEQDMDFFGIRISPEKEVILIASETSAASDISDAVKKLPCFDAPGSGMICTLPADSFFHLGTAPVQE